MPSNPAEEVLAAKGVKMLVLDRYIGETILIGDNIIITVCDVSANKARIGVSAPKEIPVHRSEVAERIAKESRKRDG